MNKSKTTTPAYFSNDWYYDETGGLLENGVDDYDPLFDFDFEAAIDASEVTGNIEKAVSFVGLFFNVIHLFFLLCKELRSIFIFIIMIGISISDILVVSRAITEFLLSWDPLELVEPTCPGLPYYNVFLRFVTEIMEDSGRLSSGFLALCMAAIRSLSVTFPMSSSVQSLMKPRSALLTVLTSFFVSTGWIVFGRRKTRIKKAGRCEDPTPISYVRYDIASILNETEPSKLAMNGYFAVFVSVLHVAVTIPLVVELRKARHRRKNLRSDRSDDTTKFVIGTSSVFFLAELIYGIATVCVQQLFNQYSHLQFILMLYADVPIIFLTFNSTVHVVICFFMSSQYPDVVRRVISHSDATPSSIVEPATTSSAWSWKTSRNSATRR